jgi:hypothetical protein
MSQRHVGNTRAELAPKLKPKRPALSEGWMWTWCDPKLQSSNSLKVDHSTACADVRLRPPAASIWRQARSPTNRKVYSARTMIIKVTM